MTHRHRKDTLLVVFALGLAGSCAYAPGQLPATPTAASEVSRAPVSFTIDALAQADRRAAFVHLRAWAEDGRHAELDATCASDRGAFEQSRARVLRGPALLKLTGSVALTTITCRTDNGLSASTQVDLSAWALEIRNVEDALLGGDRSVTRVALEAVAFGWPVTPLTLRQVDWGDGVIELWQGHLAQSAHLTLVHTYARAGSFLVVPRVAWSGGEAALPVLVTRICQPHDELRFLSPNACTATWRTP
ncbi:MAG: hypothetical protein Q8O42_09650 [Acidobacteriota bacterium]|nr:hypothetical protein [Acidobacteriota bacterium]